MNKKSFLVLTAFLCSVVAYAWQIDTAGKLKIFHKNRLIFEECGLADRSFAGNPAAVTDPVFTAKRSVSKVKDDFVIALNATFSPVNFVPAYRFRIPEEVLKDAELTVIAPGKKGRAPVEIPGEKSWKVENVVFLAVKKGDLTFALDFEWTGSSAFQHYRDEAFSGTLERDEKGLLVTMFRREAPAHGGSYNAQITLRTAETDYVRLHGTHQAHYKKNMPVSRFFTFTPEKKSRPVRFGGSVWRDDDIKQTVKHFVKAMVVPIKYRIPGKYGNGGMTLPKQLKYSENNSENPVYAYAVSGGKKEHEFTMSLPDGYYFLTFHVRDDSVKTPYEYSAEVNGVKRMIAVKGADAVATRFVVKVENGIVNIKFSDRRNPWRLSGISAAWIAGIADMDVDVAKMKEFQI